MTFAYRSIFIIYLFILWWGGTEEGGGKDAPENQQNDFHLTSLWPGAGLPIYLVSRGVEKGKGFPICIQPRNETKKGGV